jgi:hypothetical protein
MKRIIFSLVSVVMLIFMALPAVGTPFVAAVIVEGKGVEIQLAMILDGSDSISPSDWTIMVNGLADAVENPDCVPHDGSVELTVIQFSTNAQLEVGPVVITGANAGDVANDIRNISQMRSSTCISCGICLAADTLAASVNFDPDIKQALNLVTDGVPNRCSCTESSCGYSGSRCSGYAAQDSAECAREYALTTLLMTNDQDEFDAEGIGITDANRDWLKNNIIFPATGYSSPPESWPPPGPGWVRVVEDINEFAETICEKFKIVLYGSITAHKFNDLNGDGNQDGGEDNLADWTMTLYSGSDCSGAPLGSDETNADGNVVFTGLEEGTYSIAETLKDGWTSSTALCQHVTIATGGSATLNFGNFEITSDIEVVKTASLDGLCPGSDPLAVSIPGTVTYCYNVTNTADVTLTGIKVTDDKLGDITLGKTTLAPGESTSGTASYNVTQADIDAGDDIVNTATVTCDQEVTDNDSATVEIDAEADVKIVKTADPTSVSEAGTMVTYDYTVTNTGGVTLTGISVTDNELGNITLGATTLAPGASTNGTAQYTVTQTDIDAGDDIVNTATVTCDQEVSDEDDATVTIEQQLAVSIEKTASPTSVSVAGTVVTYTYTVTNNDNITLTGLNVTDNKLGDITLGATTLAPGASTNGTAQYTVTQTDIDAGDDIVNTATVTCDQEVTDDATATVTITRGPPPRGGGGGGCPSLRYLTVDWEGNNTTKPLYSNNKLAVDLLGPSPDGSHSLLLERGTLAPTVVRKLHYLIVIRELEETPPLPENTVALVAVNVTPVGTVFDRDIFLTLGLDELQLPENALNVTMAYYDDVNGVWVPLEFETGGPNGVAELTLSAPINHFSIFGVLAELAPTPTPPAHLIASGLNIATSVEKIWEPVTFVTKTGESVTITANVANDGGQEGTYIVELKLNGETVDTRTVPLGAGQSQPVSFTRSGLDYGQYEVEVAGLSGEFTTSRTITLWLIIVIIAAIGLIIWGVVWGRKRRRATEKG